MIEIEWQGMDAFENVLEALQPPRLEETAEAALGDAQEEGKSRAASIIARRFGWSAARVAAQIHTPDPSPSAGQGWNAEITADRTPNPLSAFPSTQATGSGIITNAWGRPVVIRKGFVGENTRSPGPFIRRGTARLPIKQLWGPTVHGTFVTPVVRRQVQAAIRNRLPKALVTRIRNDMGRR